MALLALTGAAGRIATALRPRLRAAGHRLVLCEGLGVPVADVDGALERVVECDLRDIDGQAQAFAGADLVVHLGAYSDEQAWADLLSVNIDGTRAVCEATRLAGVPRLLLASSVHAAGFVPVDSPALRQGMPLPAPDTYYGVSKAALEALGALYAARFGITVVSARIMTFADGSGVPGSLRSWLSPDDMTKLVLATLTTEARGHHVVWGVSRNTRRRVDLSPGLAIGFDPQDDAEAYAVELEQASAERSSPFLGGGFTEPAYRLGAPHGGR
ncbi:NAD-dependent epimerase/dehydratase family protein [Terrabacter sp. 2RAF25]|uniref:NAD-dependent epimerase/dehydratase family protein n=1 Tax=Terrabacter sp. 2RAF25 TaxID=3232998 RepID=UPI003F961F3C